MHVLRSTSYRGVYTAYAPSKGDHAIGVYTRLYSVIKLIYRPLANSVFKRRGLGARRHRLRGDEAGKTGTAVDRCTPPDWPAECRRQHHRRHWLAAAEARDKNSAGKPNGTGTISSASSHRWPPAWQHSILGSSRVCEEYPYSAPHSVRRGCASFPASAKQGERRVVGGSTSVWPVCRRRRPPSCTPPSEEGKGRSRPCTCVETNSKRQSAMQQQPWE